MKSKQSEDTRPFGEDIFFAYNLIDQQFLILVKYINIFIQDTTNHMHFIITYRETHLLENKRRSNIVTRDEIPIIKL